MDDPKDFVLRAKLSDVTGHYISALFIGRITNLSRRSIYYRMSGQIPFKPREITLIAKFFEAYGVTRNDIVGWIKQDYARANSPDASSTGSA